MKKIFLLSFVVSVLLVSCGKEEDFQPADLSEKFAVKFKTRLFDRFDSDFKSGTLPGVFGGEMPKLYTRVFNLEDNELVYDHCTLPAGDYVAVFVASNHFFYRHSAFGESGGDGWDDYFDVAGLDTRFSVELQEASLDDIFYKKVYFTVTNKAIDQTVVLNRIVAGAEIVIEDEIPGEVVAFELSVLSDASNFNFADDSRTGSVRKVTYFSRSQPIKANLLGLGNRSLNLKAFDIDGKLLANKTMSATFFANKRTTFSGKVFNDPAFKLDSKTSDTWETAPALLPL